MTDFNSGSSNGDNVTVAEVTVTEVKATKVTVTEVGSVLVKATRDVYVLIFYLDVLQAVDDSDAGPLTIDFANPR